jgi:hypothetical protein
MPVVHSIHNWLCHGLQQKPGMISRDLASLIRGGSVASGIVIVIIVSEPAGMLYALAISATIAFVTGLLEEPKDLYEPGDRGGKW